MPGRFAHRGRVFMELVRHCTARSLVSDTLVPHDATRAVGQVLALVAGPGLVIPFLLIMKYLYLATTAPAWIPAAVQIDRCLFISYALAVTGIAAARSGMPWAWTGATTRPCRPCRSRFAPCIWLPACRSACAWRCFSWPANRTILLFPVVLEIGEGAGAACSGGRPVREHADRLRVRVLSGPDRAGHPASSVTSGSAIG